MNIKEAIKTLDEVIPPPYHSTVDLDHLPIAQAWETVKSHYDFLKTLLYTETATASAQLTATRQRFGEWDYLSDIAFARFRTLYGIIEDAALEVDYHEWKHGPGVSAVSAARVDDFLKSHKD